MRQEDYTVRLDAFQGPLDLLLYLIRRAEVDVADIPIALVTDQYLDLLRQIDRIDIEQAGEFLVMAATLMEIKSRLLMPAESNGDGSMSPSGSEMTADGLDQSDPRYELVMQLMAYKRFRDVADELDHRRHAWESRYPVSGIRAVTPGRDSGVGEDDETTEEAEPLIETDIEDLGAWDLFAVFQRIIESIDFGKLGAHTVEYDDTPISIHEEDLMDLLSRTTNRMISLRSTFQGRRLGEVIGLFLATLELIKQGAVTVEQDHHEDDIVIVQRDLTDAENPTSHDHDAGDNDFPGGGSQPHMS